MQYIKEKTAIKKDDQLESIKSIIETIEKNTFDINILSLTILASTQEDNLSSIAAKIRTLSIVNKNNISNIKGFLNQLYSTEYERNNETNKVKKLIKNLK